MQDADTLTHFLYDFDPSIASRIQDQITPWVNNTRGSIGCIHKNKYYWIIAWRSAASRHFIFNPALLFQTRQRLAIPNERPKPSGPRHGRLYPDDSGRHCLHGDFLTMLMKVKTQVVD